MGRELQGVLFGYLHRERVAHLELDGDLELGERDVAARL